MTIRIRAILAALLIIWLVGPLAPATTTATAADEPPEGCLDLAPVLSDERTPAGGPIEPRPDGRGRWVPVVLVHGFTSTSVHDEERKGAFSSLIDLQTRPGAVDTGRSLVGQLQSIPGAAVYTFDYQPWSARWVTDRNLGPALTGAIQCLADLTGERVIVVGHSMGGLLARYAVAQTRDGEPVADDVSPVITFGTPETGSLLAAVLGGVTDLAALAAPPTLGVLRMLLAGCGAVTSTVMDAGTLCDLLPPFVAAGDSSAGRALRMGSEELDRLAPFPDQVPVAALAGRTTFRVPEMTWFGAHPWRTTDAPVGDVVVDEASAVAGATTTKTIECAYQLHALRGALDDVGVALQLTADVDRAKHPFETFQGACFHNNLMRSIELTNEAIGVVNDDITARDVHAVDWANATIPGEVCEQAQPITFTNSEAQNLTPYPGQSWPMDAFAYSDQVTYGDVTRDGQDEALLTIECTNDDATAAGRLVWAIVVFDGSSGRIRPIGTITGQQQREGVLPTNVGVAQIDDDGVRVQEAFYGPEDGTCCPSGIARTLWTWDGSALRPESSEVIVPAIDPSSPDAPLADADGFGPVQVGMTLEEAQDAVGPALLSTDELGTCTAVGYRTVAGDATAYVHEGAVLTVQLPQAGRTDRGIGYGSNLDDLRAEYGPDHSIEIIETQAGGAVFVTTGDPAEVGFGNPGGLIGFPLNEDGEFDGPPLVGGIPGFEYCSG